MNILSIIIPIYNVEKYITECLDSIVGINSIEIILVNDCTQDNSVMLVQSYMNRYSNITLIEHKKNEGLGAARNTGISHATGKYVMFLDSDDYLDHRQLTTFVTFLSSHNYDQVLISFLKFDKTGVLPVPYEHFYKKNDGKILTKNDFKKQLDIINIAPIRILKKSKIDIDNIKFPNGFYEDVLWSFWFIYSSNETIVYNNKMYYYRQHEESILGKKSERHKDLIKQYRDILKLYKDNKFPKTVQNDLKKHYIKHLKYIVLDTDRLYEKDRELFFLEIIQQMDQQLDSQTKILTNINAKIKQLVVIKFIYHPIKKYRAYKALLNLYYITRS